MGNRKEDGGSDHKSIKLDLRNVPQTEIFNGRLLCKGVENGGKGKKFAHDDGAKGVSEYWATKGEGA